MALNFHSVSVIKRYTGHEIQILPFFVVGSNISFRSIKLKKNWI